MSHTPGPPDDDWPAKWLADIDDSCCSCLLALVAVGGVIVAVGGTVRAVWIMIGGAP